MKKIFLGFVSLVYLFIFSSSASGQGISLNEAQDFHIEKLEGKELILGFSMEVENLSNKGIGVKIKRGKLFKDGKYYGAFQLVDKVKLKKNTKDKVNIRIKVTLEKELKLADEAILVMMGKPIVLKLTGKIKATWLIFWRKYPFEHEEKISLKNFMNN